MTALLERFFTRLPGVWTVARAIEDSRFGAGRFDGEAVFAQQCEGALAYAETGELIFGGWRGPAYRRWLYARDAGVLNIFYPDGKALLHRFDFAAGGRRAEHTHLCGEDQYCAVLTLADEGGFTLRHAVDGPAKRYVLDTAYRLRPSPGNEIGPDALNSRVRSETPHDGHPL